MAGFPETGPYGDDVEMYNITPQIKVGNFPRTLSSSSESSDEGTNKTEKTPLTLSSDSESSDEDNIKTEKTSDSGNEELSMEKIAAALFLKQFKREDETNIVLYSCEFCYKDCKTNEKLYEHLKLHKPFSCPNCPKNFISNSDLNRHMIVHSEEKPYQCDICNCAYKSPYVLKSHSVIHEPCPSHCVHCGLVLVDQYQLSVHLKEVHGPNKPFQCNHCGRGHRTKSELMAHEATHSSESLHQCDMCSLSYKSFVRLKQHKRRVHSNKWKIEKFPCPYCKKNFKSKYYLPKHLLTHELLKCKLCDIVFQNEEGLTSHMKVHSGTEDKPEIGEVCIQDPEINPVECLFKKYTCKRCGCIFNTKTDLTEHMENHPLGFNYSLGSIIGDLDSEVVNVANLGGVQESNSTSDRDNDDISDTNLNFAGNSDCKTVNRSVRASNTSESNEVDLQVNSQKYKTDSKSSLAGKSFTCLKCNLNFNNQPSWFNHMQNHPSTSSKNAIFPQETNLISKNPSIGKTLRCNKCNIDFDLKREAYIYHMKSHNVKSSDTSSQSESEDTDDSGHANVKCGKCSVNLVLNYDVTYLRDTKYYCWLCDKSFNTKYILPKNLLQEKVFKCLRCETYFDSRPSWYEHMKFHPVEMDSEETTCSNESVSSDQVDKLDLNNEQVCKQCGVKIYDLVQLRLHQSAHRHCFVKLTRLTSKELFQAYH